VVNTNRKKDVISMSASTISLSFAKLQQPFVMLCVRFNAHGFLNSKRIIFLMCLYTWCSLFQSVYGFEEKFLDYLICYQEYGKVLWYIVDMPIIARYPRTAQLLDKYQTRNKINRVHWQGSFLIAIPDYWCVFIGNTTTHCAVKGCN
jgi:hypothetical protein